jgi:diguanylate cyclase (GGDEF)-like protein
MTTAIEHLASLTLHRDRDLLDVTLAHAMRDLFRPAEVAIHMLVGPAGGAQRWLLRARLKAGDVAATSDPGWAALEDLPLREDKPLLAASIERQAVLHCDGPGAECSVLFPMAVQAEQPMVMELRCSAPFGEDARHTADNILRVYRNFCGLIDYSERDTLTGLLNRKTFDEAFYKLTQGAHTLFDIASGRRQTPVPEQAQRSGHWLGVLDIDHFKRVNDEHGHLIGDEVLLLVGRILRSTFRFQDRLYRFGGEEFVAVLRCPTEADAQAAFERLRRNMAAYAFPKVGGVTVSIGFTEVLAHDTPSAAFERADKAVYHAKQNGRNQVCSHAALVAAGLLAPLRQESEVELF